MADFIGNTTLQKSDGLGWENATGAFSGLSVIIQNIHPTLSLYVHLGPTQPPDNEEGFVLRPYKYITAVIDTSLWLKGAITKVHISEAG